MKVRRNIGRRSKRSRSGMQLIELVFAVGLSGFLTAVLGASIAQLVRQATVTQNQLVASTIAQEVLDRLRATKFDNLSTVPPGQQDVVVNADISSPTSDVTLHRPLMIDAKNLTWKGSSGVGQIPTNQFRGKVQITVSDFPDAGDTKTIDVTVTWSDSSGSGHSLTRHAIIHRFGVARNVI